jgi:hypothetical protein
MRLHAEVPARAKNPPTPERPMGGPDAANQPPPPPPETDPKQEYTTAEIPLERPQSNDANRPLEADLRTAPDPPPLAASGVDGIRAELI